MFHLTVSQSHSLFVELSVLVNFKHDEPVFEFLSSITQLLIESYTVETEETERHCDTQRSNLILQVLITVDFLQQFQNIWICQTWWKCSEQ